MSACEQWARASLPLETTVLGHAVREARHRAAELRIDERAFVERLRADRSEVERLLRTVVPPETWLFRHAAAFDRIRAWLLERPRTRVRMLSLGCARGPEPFSLAATAASVGRSAADTEIVGVDWCEANLREAESGSSSPLAQRGPLPEWAAASFAPDERGWLRLDAGARRMLRWVHADIVRDPLPGTAHLVLCRNVAIYLGDEARRELARRLAACTEPDGLLFVGHADPTCLWEGAFAPSDTPASFGHRPVGFPPAPAAAPNAPPSQARIASPLSTPSARPRPKPSVPPPIRLSPELGRAKEFADEGRLEESSDLLERLLGVDPLRADGWSVLGAVRLAQGRVNDAEACFRKVVYLQPDHALSLLQLSALAAARGEHAVAERLRSRAARAAPEETE